MKNYRVHLVVALITFTVGVGTVAAWLAFHHPLMKSASNVNLDLPEKSVVSNALGLTAMQSVSQPTGTLSSELNFIRKMKSEQTEFYSIEASYPQLVDLSIKNAQKFNEMIEQLILKEIIDYRRYKKVEAQQDKDASGSFSESDITYQIIFSTAKIISVRFEASSNSNRQLHSDDYYISVNYDLETSNLLKLGDLFKTRANYLTAFSQYCVSQLTQDYWSPDWWMLEGTTPKLKNFRNWNITSTGILISFEAYQVGVGGMGKPEVNIPYTELKRVLAKKSIVNSLSQG